MLSRRHFIISGTATAALAATSTAALGGLDPVNPDIKFGTTGSIFGSWNEASGGMKMSTDMRMMLEDVKHYGLQGFEPYSGQVVQYLGKPQELKKLAQEVGVEIAQGVTVKVVKAMIAEVKTRGEPAAANDAKN